MLSPYRKIRRKMRTLLGRAGLAKTQLPTLRLVFTTPDDFADFLADGRARRRYQRFEVTVDPWRPIRPDWAGRLGPLLHLVDIHASYDPDGLKASASFSTRRPVVAAEAVRAAYPLFYPVRISEVGSRVGVHPDAPVDERWNLGGGLRHLLPEELTLDEYIDFDVLIDAAGAHRLDRNTETMGLMERQAAPEILINPKIHRPLKRRHPGPETFSAQALIKDGRLVVQGEGKIFLDAPAVAPLTATNLWELWGVTDLDASAMGTSPDAVRRLAELAAYGAVLHNAAPGLPLVPELANLISQPFGKTSLLNHMNRAQTQVRLVMNGHTRALTTRPTPAISVILPTLRAELLPQILTQIAAQNHPNLEVVIGCHGVPAPALAQLPEVAKAILGPVLEFPSEAPLGSVLAGLTEAASGEFIAKMDDDDLYGPHHLTDLLAAWHYTEAELIG
ncbi:MAG: glycosyltransferase, partial [Propionibacteriaceae bacterium]|nr:glycosyltransferase [Propionibacteriaceae bacterium]